MLVVDASAIVASLSDLGATGEWTRFVVSEERVVSTHLMPFEAANVLRRLVRLRQLSESDAVLALRDLRKLAVSLIPFDVVADRAWQLRANLTIYDASYVAVAEWMGADLVTLDRRLAAAPGVRCRVLTPPSGHSSV